MKLSALLNLSAVWSRDRTSAWLLVLLVALVAGCQSGSSSSGSLLNENTNQTDDPPPTDDNNPLTNLFISAMHTQIQVGETTEFVAIGRYQDGSLTVLTSTTNWTVDDPSVLDLSDPSQAEGLSAGTATVTATHDDGGNEIASDPFSVAVLGSPPVVQLQSLDLTASSLSLLPGATATLGVTGSYSDGSSEDLTDQVNWVVGDQSVIQVTVDDDLLALAAGASSLQAQLNGVSSNVLSVNVVQPTGNMLTPGSGWSGSTSTPSAVGSSSNKWYTEKSISNWDVVPYQRITGSVFNLGVVAFHGGGIDYVSIGVDGNWVDVHEMTYNDRTDVHEYVAVLDLSQFSQDQYEFRAIAYPNHGKPRLLESLKLFVDPAGSSFPVAWVDENGSDSADGTESDPFRTVQRAIREIATENGGRADGGTVYCKAGQITFNTSSGHGRATTVEHYVTVTRAPGTSRDDVVFVDFGDGTDTKYIKIQGVKLDISDQGGTSNIPGASQDDTDHIWFEDCLFRGGGRTEEPGGQYGPGPVKYGDYARYYMTDTVIENTGNGPKFIHLSRNLTIRAVAEDAFRNPKTLINTLVEDQWKPTGSPLHADTIQFHGNGTMENRIFYNFQAIDIAVNNGVQVFFAKSDNGAQLENTALVNWMVDVHSNIHWSKIKIGGRHLLMWNCEFRNQRFEWIPDYYGDEMTKSSVRNSYFHQFSLNNGEGGWDTDGDFDNVHLKSTNTGGFVGGGPSVGTNVTSGGSEASLFLDVAGNDFRPMPNAALDGSQRPTAITTPLTPADVLGRLWRPAASVGPYEMD